MISRPPGASAFSRKIRSLQPKALLVLLASALSSSAASAQMAHVPPPTADTPAWKFSWDAQAFVGWNYQYRKFKDFQEVESQNWLMGAADRPLGGGQLRAHAMFSMEPFTVQPLGSPQVFQTGETYQQAPLIDYQHPHELFMAIAAKWTKPIRRGRISVGGGPVDSPALGPTPYMHRASAAENPTAPLGHHQLDASHITHGVVTGGVQQGAFTIEASWFQGAEPDENRKDIDFGALDSYSGRLSWRRGAWDAQFSAGQLTTPEYVEPFSDVTRLTASIGHAGGRQPRCAARLGTEPRDPRRARRLPVRDDGTAAAAPRVVHPRRTDDEGCAQPGRTPSAGIHSLSPAFTGRRVHRGIRVRPGAVACRALWYRCRRDRLLRAAQPARQLWQPRVVPRLPALPPAGARQRPRRSLMACSSIRAQRLDHINT